MNGSLMGPAPTLPESSKIAPAPACQAKPDQIQANQERYRTIRDIAPEWIFSATFRKNRGVLETARQRLRDRMKPLRDQDERLTKELDRLDELVRLAWQAGARSRDGKILVETVPAEQRWSRKVVEKVATVIGKTYEELERLAEFGDKLVVRWYR